jgi:pyruvate,water dikinase
MTPMADDYIVWFDRYREPDRARVGGKNASLGELMAAGLPVPPGFAITINGYHTLRDHSELRAAVHGLLAGIDGDDQDGLEEISRQIRAAIEDVAVAAELEGQVRASYEELCRRCGTEDTPVAVRSSATAEDLSDASFAGEHDTYLWVRGADAVLDRMRRCWSSIYTARAISYRRQMGHDHDVISMSVGVQKMVEPRTAGVAFTLNPRDGDRSCVAIEAAWGLGEEVNPDSFLVDKVLLAIVRRTVSCKTIEYRVTDNDVVEKVPVDPERQSISSLTDEEVCAVARLAHLAEKHYRHPQDVEWAVDAHLPADQNVLLLQSRPETVWSNRVRGPIAGASGIQGIVATLLAPLQEREAASRPEGAEQMHAS